MARTLPQHRDLPPATIPKLLLTFDEAGQAASMSPREIRRKVAERELAAVRIGRRCVRIRVQDLQRWIDSRATRAVRATEE